MDSQIKQRLVGAAVVISLGVIFLPMILDGGRHADFEKIRVEIPARPSPGFSSVIEPVTPARPVEAQTRPVIADDVEQEGVAPVVDDEIAEIMAPIEVPPEAVIKPPEPKPVENAKVTPKPAQKADSTAKPVVQTEAQPAKAQPAKAQPSSTNSPVSAWVIQVGSFDSRENAVVLRDKLRKGGFTAFVESFEKADKSSHRVRIGPEVDRGKAEKTLQRLNSSMKLSGIVVSYP